jgi:hypothetical protein
MDGQRTIETGTVGEQAANIAGAADQSRTTPHIPSAESVRAIADVRRECGQDGIAEQLECAAGITYELYAALEHVLAGALSLPRFAEDQARSALAKARIEA